eukprot:Skav223749  [mRNA]  locus=scaffold3575:237011:237982:- [translate_table: standard]
MVQIRAIQFASWLPNAMLIIFVVLALEAGSERTDVFLLSFYSLPGQHRPAIGCAMLELRLVIPSASEISMFWG